MIAAVLIAVGGLRYEQLHAWALDLGGFAVKGAPIADRNEAHRTFLLHLPLLALVLVLWTVVGGGLLALAAFWAGAPALPDFNLENFLSRRLLFVTVFGMGAAVAGLAHLVDESTGRRPP